MSEAVLRAFCPICGGFVGAVEREDDGALLWRATVWTTSEYELAVNGRRVHRRVDFPPNYLGRPGVDYYPDDEVFATCREEHKMVADLNELYLQVQAGKKKTTLPLLYHGEDPVAAAVQKLGEQRKDEVASPTES